MVNAGSNCTRLYHQIGWVCGGVCVCVCMHALCAKLLQLCLFVTLWTIAHRAPLSMGFSREEYWSGLPCPPPRDLPNPGIEPTSLVSLALAGKFFTTSTNWEAVLKLYMLLIVTYDMSLNHINRERSGWRLHGPSEGQRSFHLMVVSTPSSTFPSSCSLESSMNTWMGGKEEGKTISKLLIGLKRNREYTWDFYVKFTETMPDHTGQLTFSKVHWERLYSSRLKLRFTEKKKKNRLVVDAYNLFITNHLFKVIWNKSASNEYKWDTERNEQTLGERMKVKSHSVGINTN